MQLRPACAVLALLGGVLLLAVGLIALVTDAAGWHDAVALGGYVLVLLALALVGFLLVERAPIWLGLIVAVCTPLLVASVWQALFSGMEDGDRRGVVWLVGGVVALVLGGLELRSRGTAAVATPARRH